MFEMVVPAVAEFFTANAVSLVAKVETAPLLSSLIRSVVELAPSAVVANISLDGLDDALQVPPSRLPVILTDSEWPLSENRIIPSAPPSAGVAVPVAMLMAPADVLATVLP